MARVAKPSFEGSADTYHPPDRERAGFAVAAPWGYSIRPDSPTPPIRHALTELAMSELEDEALLAPRLRTMQIILGAMVMGVCIFVVIVLLLPTGNVPPPVPVITYVGLLLGVMALAAQAVLPNLLVAAGRRRLAQTDPDELGAWCAIYQ